MTDKVLKKYSSLFFLFLIIVLGLFLRLRWWPEQVTFGFEQSRDAIAAREIFTLHKPTLLGPTTEIEGIFHGPIYYYLIGFIYFLFGPNPANVSLFHILANLTAIPAIYFVGKKLINRNVGLIAALLFAVSFEVISYGLWLSNPSPALTLIIFSYYFFYKAFKENRRYLPLASFLLALSTSFDLIIVMHLFGAIALYFIYNRKPIPLKTWFFSICAFVVPLITYPLFELRHKFLMTNTFIKVLGSQDAVLKTVYQYLGTYFNGLAKEFANLFFPIHGFFAGILMFYLFYFLYQNLKQNKSRQTFWPLIAVMLFANLPTFFIAAAVTNSEFSYFGVNAAAILLFAVLIDKLIAGKKVFLAFVLIFLIVAANLRAWQSYFPNPKRKLFDSQRGVILKDNLAAIDYTYREAGGQPFFVDKVTVPLFISPLWEYLYSWHGENKYGYLPTNDNKTNLQFLIIEPGWGETYEIFKTKAKENLNKNTAIEEEVKFGMITVEKRLFLSGKK